MLKEMYNIMDIACEKVSNVTGISIKFPRPSKRALKISAFINGLVGIGFTLFGVLSTHKWTILLGVIGLISGALEIRHAK